MGVVVKSCCQRLRRRWREHLPAGRVQRAVPQFFFHLYNRLGEVPDEEGLDLTDLARAEARAVESIRSMVSDDVKMGLLDLRGRIEIVDGGGEVLKVVHFADAVELRLSEAGR